MGSYYCLNYVGLNKSDIRCPTLFILCWRSCSISVANSSWSLPSQASARSALAYSLLVTSQLGDSGIGNTSTAITTWRREWKLQMMLRLVEFLNFLFLHPNAVSLSTQTEHIPALYRCWEAVPTQKSNRKIGPFLIFPIFWKKKMKKIWKKIFKIFFFLLKFVFLS